MENHEMCAHLIQRARSSLLVLGAQAHAYNIGEKLDLEYCLEVAKAANSSVCTTAHTEGKILKSRVIPESSYDVVKIINSLKEAEWKRA
jgi:CO dehydrogenase/acetyl-CoA synthase epsilon subunit